MSQPMDQRPANVPPALVALCGWLVPGAGYFLLGERARGVIIAAAVLFIFVAGLLIGGVCVVETPKALTTAAILDKPWFIGQVLAGPVSIVSAVAAGRLDDGQYSTSRSWELGTLYTAIAGMLNLLVVIDATHLAAGGPPADGGGGSGSDDRERPA
jgi:TM2 domain-containing membrane protein YozV